MAFPDGLLSRGEQVVVHKHPHWKVLVVPTALFLVIVAALAFMIVWIGKWDDAGFTTHRWWILAVAVVAAVTLLVGCAVPFLRWRTEHFVLTTQHVFFRTGILHRRQHQIPLIRVQNIETIVTFWGRVFGYGTLIVDSAADEPLEFSNVASILRIQGTLNQLISDDRDRYPDPDLSLTRPMPLPDVQHRAGGAAAPQG